jgi:hypothetical protein
MMSTLFVVSEAVQSTLGIIYIAPASRAIITSIFLLNFIWRPITAGIGEIIMAALSNSPEILMTAQQGCTTALVVAESGIRSRSRICLLLVV